MATTGLWNIGPINLPDWGITERRTGWQANPAAVQSYGAPQSTPPSSSGLQSIPGGTTYTLGPNASFVPNIGTSDSGQVLGSQTDTSASTGTGPINQGGSGSINQGNLTSFFPGYAGWNPNAAWQDYLNTGGAGKGGQTGGGQPGPDYSGYYSQLDQIFSNLGEQSQNLQNVAQAQTAQQQSDLDLQKTQGEQQLGSYQAKSLKDIGSNIANALRAGNTYLGSIGAGDSSAANQYAYALAKEGSKQRGTVMADVSNRLQGLKQVYDMSTNRLKLELSSKVNQIAQWFSQQQAALQGQKAEVAKQQSDQAYQMAVNALQTVQQQAAGMQNALNTWVANNATSIQQVQQQIRQNVANNPIPTAMNYDPRASGASTVPAYFGGSGGNDNRKQNGLFNNYNWLNTG